MWLRVLFGQVPMRAGRMTKKADVAPRSDQPAPGFLAHKEWALEG